MSIKVVVAIACLTFMTSSPLLAQSMEDVDSLDTEIGISDPLEGVNRTTFKFNQSFDRHIGVPVAKTYHEYTPDFVRTGICNFFGNLQDIVSLANTVLQGRFKDSVLVAGRVVFNTTFGGLGLVDWASMNGMRRHTEDFGQTLAVWGVPQGPYLVLPFIGPSSLRDAAGLVADAVTVDPLYNPSLISGVYDYSNVSARNTTITIKMVSMREHMLKATEIADDAALDPYVFYRDYYYQHRYDMVQK